MDERVSFISGFTGSNASCLITQEEALLWTDGRYYIQAEKELSKDWILMKMERNEITLNKYIEDILHKKLSSKHDKKTVRIGMDKNLITSGIYYFEI